MGFVQGGVREVPITHGGERGDVELGTEDGSHAQHVVGVIRQAGQPAADDLADPFGDTEISDRVDGGGPARVVVTVEHAGLGQVHQHLLEEERVTFGLGVQCVREVRLLRFVSGGGFQELGDLADRQAGQCDPAHVCVAVYFG